MSENYYDDLLKRLEKDFSEEKYEDVKKAVQEELEMPFVPRDVLDKLNQYQEKLSLLERKEKRQVILTPEELHQYLKENSQKAHYALKTLQNSNARMYLDEIKEILLDKEVKHTLKSLLIQILVLQQIDEKIEYYDDGRIYTVDIKELPDVLKQESIPLIYEKMSKIIKKDPYFLNQCQDIMINAVYDHYPQLIDVSETDLYAYSIIRYVFKAYGDNKQWEMIRDYYGIDENTLLDFCF